MILSPNHHHLARSPSHPTLAFFRKPQQRLRQRRRRLNLSRPPPHLSIRSDSNFLDAFISQIPSAISRLGLTNRASRCGEISDWILVASPTPFNRFVLLAFAFAFEHVANATRGVSPVWIWGRWGLRRHVVGGSVVMGAIVGGGGTRRWRWVEGSSSSPKVEEEPAKWWK
ncbi:hypothetical protein Scep_016976 [Stephania cephalantha]|uniref:Uncharacterized protein n=1 Tax=Stephania cephalantha TaxID=152367 RepID=A0AAP0NTU0_9MAGN